jgi:hypothetical protein
MGELNVPLYPQDRVFRNLADSLCVVADTDQGVTLVIRDRSDWRRGQWTETRVEACS